MFPGLGEHLQRHLCPVLCPTKKKSSAKPVRGLCPDTPPSIQLSRRQSSLLLFSSLSPGVTRLHTPRAQRWCTQAQGLQTPQVHQDFLLGWALPGLARASALSCSTVPTSVTCAWKVTARAAGLGAPALPRPAALFPENLLSSAHRPRLWASALFFLLV